MKNKIVTLCKDEDNLIADFCIYHLSIGFDEIIIFDDCSQMPIVDLIENLPFSIRAKVTVIRIADDFESWSESSLDSKYFFDKALYREISDSKQIYLLNFSLRNYLSAVDWVAFIDVDEFISVDCSDISIFRHRISSSGYAAMVFDSVLYGHGFNLSKPKANNVCSFIWRGENLLGHGRYGYCKFYAHVGALKLVETPHFPTLYRPELVVGSDWQPRSPEQYTNYKYKKDMSAPHIKHYIIQDVYSCFSRRLRRRVSNNEVLGAGHSSWLDKIKLLGSTSRVTDCELAIRIIDARDKVGYNISEHLQALSNSVETASRFDSCASTLDFNHLRASMRLSTSMSDEAVLYEYFQRSDHSVDWLQFENLPQDFSIESYREINEDLRGLSNRAAIDHYFQYGRAEGRRYIYDV